jgi:hypothetical protein
MCDLAAAQELTAQSKLRFWDSMSGRSTSNCVETDRGEKKKNGWSRKGNFAIGWRGLALAQEAWKLPPFAVSRYTLAFPSYCQLWQLSGLHLSPSAFD